MAEPTNSQIFVLICNIITIIFLCKALYHLYQAEKILKDMNK